MRRLTSGSSGPGYDEPETKTMNADRSREVKTLLKSALGRPPGERKDFLAEACAGDEPLRAEVESLLAANTDAGNSLEHSLPPPDSLIGTVVGSYRIVKMLGVGGMGEVYLALDTRLGRQVALKFLRSDVTSDPRRVGRFRQEARAASALNHPNILTIHELGEHEGIQFIASELVEGETLRTRLDRGPMDLPDIIRITSQVASALRTAHAAGVIHRDIKPENIMVRPDGYAKVLDFGLAKLSEPSAPVADESTALRTGEGAVMGTPRYMSPEQLRGQTADGRSDQWSLGVVLYEMLAGRRPFDGPSQGDVIAAILQKEPSKLNAPEKLQRIVAKALRKNRDERYKTVDELLADLTFSQEELDTARPRPRLKWLVAGAALAVALATATATVLVLKRDRNPPTEARADTVIRSLAVLPFANLSGDSSNEYLSDGMTEELISSLGRIPKLKVVARTSSFAMKGTSADVREVGKKLNVGAVIEGSVHKSGNRVRVRARLVNTSDGYQVWTDSYERELNDVFAIETEIASAVAEALRVRFEDQSKPENPTNDLQAYELYLKGRQSADRWTREGLNNAVRYYRAAIARDPSFAAAWAGLADTYAVMDHRVGLTSLKPEETYRLAEEAARKALSLDPRSAEAWAAMGHIQLHQGQWAKSEASLKRALELNPNAVMSHLWYASYLQTMQRTPEVKEQFLRARELDPLSVQVYHQAISLLWYGSEFEMAIDFARQGLEIAPDYGELYLGLAKSFALLGRLAEAEDATRRAAEAKEAISFVEEETAMIVAAAGRPSDARQMLRTIEREKGQPNPVSMMRAYAAAGDIDNAARWMDRFVKTNPYSARVNLNVPRHPLFARFIGDERFRAARRAVGLPPIEPVTRPAAGDVRNAR